MLPWLWRQFEQRNRSPESLVSARTDSANPEDVFYDAAARFLDVQISTNDVLDNKNSNAFAVGSTVLPLTFGLLSLGTADISIAAVIALGLAMLCFGVLIGCAWRGSRIRALEYRPNIATLQEHSRTYSGDTLRRWVANEYLASTEANRAILERKARWIGAATVALYVESLFLSVAAIAALL